MVDARLTYRNQLHFFYTNNEISEREYKQTIPFKIAPKILMNKPDRGGEKQTENYKTLRKLKLIQRNWKIAHALGLEEYC